MSPQRFIFCGFLTFALCLMLFNLGNAQEEKIHWITLPTTTFDKYPLENLTYASVQKRKIALVLSGGGARGLAHIGVLKAFEEHDIPIDLIVGTSIGSIVGGFYAAGYSADEIRKILSEIDWGSIFVDEAYRNKLFWAQKNVPRRHFFQFRLNGFLPYIPSSISQGQRVFQTFYNQLIQANFQAANNFDNLRIPFRSVATDLISGDKVVLRSGDLAEAMNASMAFPLIFAPVALNDRLLIDGGVTDNLPVDVALKEDADIVLAVDVTSNLRKQEDIASPWQVADQVTSIMMKTPTEESRRKANILLRPELGDFKGGDYQYMDTIIAAGYQVAIEKIDSIKALLSAKPEKEMAPNRLVGNITSFEIKGIEESARLSLRDELARQLLRQNVIYEKDIGAALKRLHNSGFWEHIKACVREKGAGKHFELHLKAYPFIRNAHIRHQKILPDSLFKSYEAQLSGKPLNIHLLFNILAEIKNKLIQEGYALAAIQKIFFEPDNAILTISIDEGAIKKIRIAGNKVTKNFVIYREFPIKAGQVFQANKASEGIENIYSTNLFDRVAINLEKSSGENTLIVKVKEKKYFLTRLGAHYSSERHTEGFVELLQDNFLGSGIKASLFGSVGVRAKKAEALLYTVRLFDTYLTSRLKLYYEERRDDFYWREVLLSNYLITRKGSRFIIGQQIDRLGLISAELRIEDVTVGSAFLNFPYRDRYRIRSIGLQSVVDKRDKLPFPDSGIYNRWQWEAGSQSLLGGSKPFTKIFLGLEGYYKLVKRLNYHPYLYVGSADLTLPFSEYFFLGGQKKFPGLFERELFGRQFIQSGIDLRYKLKWGLPIEAFIIASYGAGAAWERPDARIEFDDFNQYMAISAAVNSLLGPLQVTYGKLVDKRAQFYFSFGFDF